MLFTSGDRAAPCSYNLDVDILKSPLIAGVFTAEVEGVSLFVLVWKGRVRPIKEALARRRYGAFHCFAGQSKGGLVCAWQPQVLSHGRVTSPSMAGLSLCMSQLPAKEVVSAGVELDCALLAC